MYILWNQTPYTWACVIQSSIKKHFLIRSPDQKVLLQSTYRKWKRRGSNPRQPGCDPGALPAELRFRTNHILSLPDEDEARNLLFLNMEITLHSHESKTGPWCYVDCIFNMELFLLRLYLRYLWFVRLHLLISSNCIQFTLIQGVFHNYFGLEILSTTLSTILWITVIRYESSVKSMLTGRLTWQQSKKSIIN